MRRNRQQTLAEAGEPTQWDFTRRGIQHAFPHDLTPFNMFSCRVGCGKTTALLAAVCQLISIPNNLGYARRLDGMALRAADNYFLLG